jgi:hypothetical protein
MLSTDEEIRPEGKEALNRLYKNNKNLSLDDKINMEPIYLSSLVGKRQ